jgi:cobaltochelatase CobT
MRPDYRAYTTKFDRVVRAGDLDSVLGRLSGKEKAARQEAWHSAQTGLLSWKTQLHLVAADASARIHKHLSDEERADTVVSLLLDQSGSMRGQKMLFAAATLEFAQAFLLTLGFACEVLGFTTSQWCGGRSRERWKWRLSPSHPGRLNDLLHIIYKSADEQCDSSGHWNLGQMLRADLPKENIDGEAVLWATERLLTLPRTRKHLIVLSDGAPVDDSTLYENGPNYLSDHLQDVVKRIVESGKIGMSAIGIGPQFHDFYPVSSQIDAPDELGAALLSLLERVLAGDEATPETR